MTVSAVAEAIAVAVAAGVPVGTPTDANWLNVPADRILLSRAHPRAAPGGDCRAEQSRSRDVSGTGHPSGAHAKQAAGCTSC